MNTTSKVSKTLLSFFIKTKADAECQTQSYEEFER